jgi:tRNA U38,U39,U40 pseudouridine synthase TruA
MMRRIALVLEYDGTRYAGFQLQTNAWSIQGTVEDAVQRLTGTASRIHGAGRTDAGVHATGQVACFDTSTVLGVDRIRSGLNHYLPDDIAVRSAATVRHMYRTQVWRQDGDEVLMELEANAYVHQQVRRIAAAVLDVGLGRTTIDEFSAVADSQVHGAATKVLPARGLTLRRVAYEDVSPLPGRMGAEQAEVTLG